MSDNISYARVKSDVESARTYNQRKLSKHLQEMAMIDEAMRHVHGVSTLLDAPCGVGRASIALARKGHETVSETVEFGALGRAKVRKAATDHALALLMRALD